jgi:hypothetical protein
MLKKSPPPGYYQVQCQGHENLNYCQYSKIIGKNMGVKKGEGMQKKLTVSLFYNLQNDRTSGEGGVRYFYSPGTGKTII